MADPSISLKRRTEIALKTADYYTPSFRKGRSSKVIETISYLKILTNNPKIDKSVREQASRKLRLITYFDYKPTRKFVAKYVKFVSLTTKVDVLKEIDYIISLFERITESNGCAYALKVCKELYSIGTRLSTSNRFKPMSFRKSTADGVPKIMGPLVVLLKGSYNERRAALSVLQLIKIVEHHETGFSVETIIREGPIKQLSFDELPVVGNYFKRYIKEKGYMAETVDLRQFRRAYFEVLEETFPTHLQSTRLKDITKFSSNHVSARNGPNGPSLTTAAVDYRSFKKDESSKQLWNNLKSFAVMTKNKDLARLMCDFEIEDPKVVHQRGKKPIHSKISIKKESWGRLRPFAILDYFTQSSMVGTHNYLFKWLEEQVEDGTFDQDRVSSVVQNWTKLGLNPESADLSAATDSIPVEIQAEILSQIGGRDYGKLWMNIVSNRDFLSPDGTFIRYKTGQPMGILSSFGMLAVWHHIIARVCLRYEGIVRSSTSPIYCIIGDDITMTGQRLFHIYETVVGTVMGIGISKVKGFHSETQTLDNPLVIDGIVPLSMTTAELAKRIFCNGHEITPIPPTEVYSALESPLQFPELFHSLRERGYSGYLNASDILSISSLCVNSKVGLTLAFSPLADTQLLANIVFDPRTEPIYNRLFWFSPTYDRYVFDIAFLKQLELTHSKFVDTMIGAFGQWHRKAVLCDFTTNGWVYNSVAQSDLLQKIVIDCAEKSEKSQFDFLQNYGNVNSLLKLRKEIRLFQTLFELGRVFVDPKKCRALDRKLFSTSYINIVVRQTLVDLRNRDLFS